MRLARTARSRTAGRVILEGIRVVAVCLDHVAVPPAPGSLLYVEVDPAADWSPDFDRIRWALG